jgi:hypothetical protein
MKLVLSVLASLALGLSALAQDFGTLISNHQICSGMTYADVFASWGNPENIVYGTKGGDPPAATELWLYGPPIVTYSETGQVVGTSVPAMVMFENGQATWVTYDSSSGRYTTIQIDGAPSPITARQW